MSEISQESTKLFCSSRNFQVEILIFLIWTAAIGESLGEPTNTIDQYTVAVIRSGLVVGHLPKKIVRVCSLF